MVETLVGNDATRRTLYLQHHSGKRGEATDGRAASVDETIEIAAVLTLSLVLVVIWMP